MSDQFFVKWAADINVSYIFGFHEFIFAELRRKEDELNKIIAGFSGRTEDEVEVLVKRDAYASTYRQHLMTVTFLLLYSHLEEWLTIIRDLASLPIEHGGSIKRFKSVLQTVVGLDLSRDATWEFLLQAGLVRDCLLHANGHLGLFTHRDEIRSVIENSAPDLYESNLRLYVDQGYIGKILPMYPKHHLARRAA